MTAKGEAKLGEILSKCISDAGFKAKFKANPAAVLKEHGIAAPEGVKIQVVENTENEVFITLPTQGAGGPELSDTDLEQVAGGGLVFSTSSFRRFIQLHTRNSASYTCSQGKDCIPW